MTLPMYVARHPDSTPRANSLPPHVKFAAEEAGGKQDWPRIGRYLASQGLGLDLSFAPRRFAGGLANLNFLLRLEDGAWIVLRRPPPGPLPPGAHDMAREHRILSGLWQHLPLAPRSLHLCNDASVAGAPFQLLQFVEGAIVNGSSLAPLPDTPATGQVLSRLLVECLAEIHAVDPAAAGLAHLGRPRGFLERGANSWTQRAVRICGGVLSPDLRYLADWLETRTVGLGGDGTLLHNDFKLDNILLRTGDMEPVAVLDWDMGTRGDALFDLATLLSYWTEPGDPECMHRLAQMPTARPGFMSREQAALAYSMKTGRALADFKVYRVMAMFKLGIVFHQLHSRYHLADAASARYAEFGNLANELLAFTRAVADDRYF